MSEPLWLFLDMARRTQNANENETWITLSAATERALQLHEKADVETNPEADGPRTGKSASDGHSDYVVQRIRDLAAFERRYLKGK